MTRVRLPVVVALRPRYDSLKHKDERRIWKLLYPETGHWRPQTRGDCIDGPRPCPYVGCRHNLYLDTRARSIRFASPHLEPWDMDPAGSCSLDIAEDGEHTLDQVGTLTNVTRERVRQIEAVALDKALSKMAR